MTWSKSSHTRTNCTATPIIRPWFEQVRSITERDRLPIRCLITVAAFSEETSERLCA
ncbi:hypothetical protein FHT32_003835 [Variovorax sp. SG517]|nr:hypothetical protein [Variovorax sp. SG517]